MALAMWHTHRGLQLPFGNMERGQGPVCTTNRALTAVFELHQHWVKKEPRETGEGACDPDLLMKWVFIKQPCDC